VLEPLEGRLLLSVTTAADSDLFFSTADQNMWASGPADTISAEFSKTLVDVSFGDSFGGYALGTGFKASFSGGFDLGFSGDFNVTGGEVDVDYQTDVSLQALTASGASLTEGTGGTLSNLAAGDSFILRSSGSPDADAIAMETRFASIDAGLYLDYGAALAASLTGKIAYSTVVSTGFSKSAGGSVKLIGATLDPGAGTAGLTLFGSPVDVGDVYSSSTGAIEVEDPLYGILQAGLYVPQLNTGIPGDGYDDSAWDGSTIVNAHLPVDRSVGRTRIDFFRLGVGLDEIVTALTDVPLSFSYGNSYARISATLINADLEAYLGIAQEMTFDPTVMVDYNFLDGNGNPVPVAVRTPGSAVYDTVTTARVPVGQDLEVIHPGGTLDIDTDYVLDGSFRNNTDLYLSPAFDLDIGCVAVTGSLVPDFSFCLYSNTFALGDPIRIGGLFDRTFDLGGFTEVDGSDLSLTAGDPTTFTVVATPADSTITEGQDMVINGTVFDPTGATDGSDTYSLVIANWHDGSTVPQTLTLNSGTTAADNGATFDPTTRTFSVSHHYVEQLAGTPQLSLTATRTGDATQTGDVIVGIQVANAAPQVSLDPLFLDNDGHATLTGSYTDLGVLDSQTMFVTWGDSLSVHPPYGVGTLNAFSLPAVGSLSVGQTFASGSQSLEVTSVDTSTGEVGFVVTGLTYVDLVLSPAMVTVVDDEGGRGQDSVQVPWGLGLTVLDSSVLTADEGSAPVLDITFEDAFWLERFPDIEHQFQEYQIVIDWDDPNDPRTSTFDVVVGMFPINPAVPNVVEERAIVTNIGGDNATVTVLDEGVDWELLPGGAGIWFMYTPVIRVSRPYADDGPAGGNGTPADVSNVVINIYEVGGVRGGTVIEPVTISDAAPTVTLDELDEVGLGGVAILTGTVEDVGVLDAFELRVNWGDGSTFDNDSNPNTPDDAYEAIDFAASPDGLREFFASHVYAEDLDGGSYTVTATAVDDDTVSGSATGAFIVDMDRPPVAIEDTFYIHSDEVLHFNVLHDNDNDDLVDAQDFDPEGSLDPSATVLVSDSFVIEDYWVDTPAPDGWEFNPDDVLTDDGDGWFTFDPTTAFAWLCGRVYPDYSDILWLYFDYQIADTTGNTGIGEAGIRIVGVNTPPVITSPATANVSENTTAVLTVTATDAEAQAVTFSISGGADQARFSIDPDTGALAFVTAPDYEAPTDVGSDNVYHVQVQATDQGGASNAQDITVSVQPVNDNAPVFTSSATASIDENTTAVLTVTATDADLPAQTVVFSLSGGVDQSRFSIDAHTGALSFITAPDYESPTDVGGDNVYNVQVQADDQNALTSTQDITVSVQPVNDNTPAITSPSTADVNENTTEVLTVTATDADLPAQTVVFSISGGVDQSRFSIDAHTGALSFITAPDYESPTDVGGDNVYNVQVQADDQNGLTSTQEITVSVRPVNDNAPAFTSPATASTDENTTPVLTVTATDADLPAQTVVFSISGGADQAMFVIDAGTGVLAFVAAPDYETPLDAGDDNVYNVQVQADDGAGLTTTQDIAVSVQPVNDNAPEFTSPATPSIDENMIDVLAVTAPDADLPTQAVKYSIVGGADASRFTLDANTGALSFATAPDYEAPMDVGGDNVYNVQVQADDQNGLTSTQNITVSVQPVNDNAPVITSPATAEVNENTTAVLTVTATDADLPAQTMTFSLSGGADRARFTIDADTGALAFVIAPDYEAPLDADADNVYEVEVKADDGNGLTSTQIVQVTVLNRASVTGTVFVDTNENGLYDADEMGIDGVTIDLLDAASSEVVGTVATADGGYYQLEDFDPGTYRIRETQPSGVTDGAEHIGSAGGSIVANDVMEVDLARVDGSDYDFSEIGLPVTSGDTATIGFWQNKHGQALIAEGGAGLADWLTANFGNIFGDAFVGAGGEDVAAFYKNQLFKQKATKGAAGPAKVDAQFMAVALATYFTDIDLAGTVAAQYGFNVTDTGIATRIVNVGDSGDAFGVANGTDRTIMQLLLAVNDLTDQPDAEDGFAHIHDRDGNGIIDQAEAQLRALADAIFSGINEQGDI